MKKKYPPAPSQRKLILDTSSLHPFINIPSDTNSNIRYIKFTMMQRLARLSRENRDKQIIFMEIGCRKNPRKRAFPLWIRKRKKS